MKKGYRDRQGKHKRSLGRELEGRIMKVMMEMRPAVAMDMERFEEGNHGGASP